MTIGGLQKTSLIDYPEKISAVIFTQGCNFRCHYCHNPDLIKNTKKSKIDPQQVLRFLFKRRKQLDGVVITGGEPTIQTDLSQYLFEIKTMGYSIKLDTNGSNPKIVEKLIGKKLIDYIAMDIKAPLKKYFDITQVKIKTEKIKQSIEHIFSSKINHEFRTTIAKAFLSLEDIFSIAKEIKNAKTYSIQNFRNINIFNPAYAKAENYSEDELLNLKENLLKYFENVNIR